MPLAIGDSPYDNAHVWAPFVTKWNDRFYMFYMSAGRNCCDTITYATSDDLETWTKSPVGPLPDAGGRDPFVRYEGDWIYLCFTANRGGIDCIRSRDMLTWDPATCIMRNPDRCGAESSSVLPYGAKWVLWYNDYYHCDSPKGDFRPVYAYSNNPLHFEPKDLKVFDFRTSLPTQYLDDDWIEKRPIPVSMELVEKGEKVWLICYFRWHIDRFRLFFGELNWETDPACITEITTPDQLERVLRQIR